MWSSAVPHYPAADVGRLALAIAPSTYHSGRPFRRSGPSLMHPSFATRANLDLLEDYYRRWRDNPAGVDDRWQAFFEGFELAGQGRGPCDTAQTNVVRMVYVY